MMMDSDFATELDNNISFSREQKMEVFSNYDGLIDYILKIDNDPSLLDIGSGRGEWIQKCNEKGFKSVGIELDLKMVNHCRSLNLNIKEGDALSVLDEFSEDSFSIVSAFHLIEHMNHNNIKELLIKSKRILKSDGLLILQTLNKETLFVSSKSFHIDQNNINPINPDWLAFIIKRIGFTKLKYYFINGCSLGNFDSDKLTRVFNGVAQDIALIASKSNLIDTSIFDDNNFIKRDMRLAKTRLDAAIDFDNYSMNRYAQYDEAIFIMRKRIIDLERKLQYMMRLYENNFLFIFINKLRKVKIKILSLTILYKQLFRYLINSKLYILIIKRLYKIQSIFFLLRYLEKKVDKYGFRIYQYKFVRKSKNSKEDCEFVYNHDRNLKTYFNNSEDAKTIFNDLNKYSNL